VSEKLRDMIEFPVLYTFKAMGLNNEKFINDTKKVFEGKSIESLVEIPSKKGNYVSLSVTVEVTDFEELQSFYISIKNISGLKYHL